jgi:hypothetical protein
MLGVPGHVFRKRHRGVHPARVARVKKIVSEVADEILAKFDPAEARDSHGRWTSGGDTSQPLTTAQTVAGLTFAPVWAIGRILNDRSIAAQQKVVHEKEQAVRDLAAQGADHQRNIAAQADLSTARQTLAAIQQRGRWISTAAAVTDVGIYAVDAALWAPVLLRDSGTDTELVSALAALSDADFATVEQQRARGLDGADMITATEMKAARTMRRKAK